MIAMTRTLFATKKTPGRRLRQAARRLTGRHEVLEPRLAMAMVLGHDPLVFDPTPGNAASGDEDEIGRITYQMQDDRSISVLYEIDPGSQAAYDLSAVHTRINGGALGDTNSTGLPDGTDSFSHSFALALPLPSGVTALDIDACATIEKRDVAAVGTALPSVGTVRVSTNGSMVGAASYFDTIVTPGWIAKSTDVDNDTVAFDADPGWATGEAVRVVQGYTNVPTNTGLVTPPGATDTTSSATYYVRKLGTDANGDFVYSFHTSYSNALADSAKQDITAALPTTGEIIITGENDALAFLGQTPINESLVPASTKTTLTTTTGPLVTATDIANDTVDLAAAVPWVSGDRVQISGASGGGLNASTTYYVRVVDSDTVSFHTSWAGAQNNTSRVNITAAIATTRTVDRVDPDDETVVFTTDPGWVTGTAVRVSTTDGGLNASTNYYVRSLGGGAYSFFDTAANATNADADLNPLNGRKDLTAPIMASVFANLTELSFENAHNWATGTVVRVNATGGGLTAGTNYSVRVIDPDTISLHTTLANAQGNISPVTFSAPIVALLTPMFDGWCVDNDRVIAGNEYIANIYSSYDLGSFSNTADDPKDSHLTEGGIAPINTSMVPVSTNTTTDQVTFSTSHGWATQQAVRVTATDGDLTAGTTYYVRVINVNTVSFHPTAAAANNAGPAPASTSFANTGVVPDSTNTTAETVTYTTDPGWPTGTLVRATATGGGLTGGANYYVCNFTGGVYSFYTNLTDAIAGGITGRMNLTAAITAQIYTVTLASTEDTVTFSPGHGFATGDIVTPTATSGGLTGGTAYTLYNVGGDTFSFHTASPTADNKVNLTANVTTNINERVNLTAALSASTLVFRAQSIDFAVNTEWPNGSPVRVNVADGGLVAGATYYARAQSIVGGATDANSISLYDTRENAVAGGATGLITFTDPIETITFTTGPTVAATDIASETVDLSAPVSWADGHAVQVSATGGGLTAGVTYYVRMIDADTVSFFTSAANARGFDTVGRVNLTAALLPTTTVNPVDPMDTTQTVFYVPELLVEYPENLDVMNWVLNQQYESQLAQGRTPTATTHVDTSRTPASTSFDNVGSVPTSTNITAETVTFGTDPGWATETMVRVDADGGGLTAATNYYVRNLGGGVYSFYNSAANATAGGATGRSNLTAAITAGVFTPSLASTEDTVTFNSGHGFVTGSMVHVTADGDGLDASTTYYLYHVDGDTFSFHTAAAAAAANKVNLTATVEPRSVYLPTDNTVTVPSYGWTTGMKVQVSAAGGGLTAGADYYIRAIDTTTIAFYASAGDASNNVNRIDLTEDIQNLVRPYYTEGDVQRAVWELIENNPGDPGNWSPLRVAEILANADEEVGLNKMSVDFVPDCDGTVAIILQPFQVNGPSNEQLTIAQITIAQIPNYCGTGFNCQEFSISLGSIGDFVWHDVDGDGIQDDGNDSGTPGLKVILLDGAGTEIDDTVTDSSGKYLFTGLLPGSYSVQFTLATGTVFTRPDVGADDEHDSDASRSTGRTGVYTLGWMPAAGGIKVTDEMSVDAGWFNLLDVCGFKVWDINRNGVEDTADQRMAGVRIFVDDNTDGVLNWTDSVINNEVWDLGEGEQWTTTQADGSYCLLDLLPGTYVIREDLSSLPGNPAEWQTSGPVTVTLVDDGEPVDPVNFYNYKFTPGEYLTYTLGGYGGSGQPAAYLLANFSDAFPNGLTVPRAGSLSDIILTTAAQVQAFLRANNPRTAFTNPQVQRYVPSTLQKQFVALTLNVGFDAYDANFGSSGLPLGDLILCNLTGSQTAANGRSISALLSQVYGFLEGNGYTLGLSPGDLTSLLDAINKGFDNGGVTTWAEEHLCAEKLGVAAAMSTPRVRTILVTTPRTRDNVITYRVTFNMPVTGVDVSDFAFAGRRGRILGVTGRGAVYNVRAVAPRVGETYRLSLRDDDSIRAMFGGHALASAFAADGSFTAPAVRKVRPLGSRAFAVLGS